MSARKWRIGLALRIWIIIVLAFLATQLLDMLLIAAVPPPRVLFYTRDWVAQQVADVVREANSTASAARAERLRTANSDWLVYSVVPQMASAETAGSLPLVDVQRAIERSLGAGAQVRVLGTPIEDPERQTRPISVILPSVPSFIENILDDGFGEKVIAAGKLQIGVRLADGNWLYATEPSRDALGALRLRNALTLIGGLALFAAFAMLTARMVIRPLRELAAAADRLGRERELTPIAATRVPEIDAIAESFNGMQQRLKRFVDERTSMLAAISHDLRTPLTRLRLFAESVPDIRQRDLLSRDIEQMEQMIRASLAFASDDLHREPHTRVDIAALLISLCDTFADTGQAAQYEGPNHAELPCRAIAIRRMFTNLLDNACKYGQRADVTLREEPDEIEITIEDTGPGIAPELIEHAFAPFRRLEDSRNRETGGAGLGLAIARDVVREHGGSLTLEPRDPVGLCARVKLPKPSNGPRVYTELSPGRYLTKVS